jgi:competence protein ComEC
VSFQVLDPAPAHGSSGALDHCVIKVSGRYGSALLTGDIDARAERSLGRRWERALASDVLLVPREGSTSASTPSFIDRVDPSWAVVSAGYLNRYGHPSRKVMTRFHRRGIRTLNTAVAGAVIVRVSHQGISVRGWRRIRPRYWLDQSDRPHTSGAI